MSNTPPPFDPNTNPKAAAKAAKAYAKATRPWFKKKRFILPIALVVVLVAVNMGGDSETEPADDTAAAADTKSETKSTEKKAPAKKKAASEKPADDAPKLTKQQENAVRSAESYLSMSGFSRQGLIDQLSSEFGDGYPKPDATVAVDSLDVNWKTEAAESAKNYLEMSGFSCQGLIDQLSSSAGDQFTKGQAEHGAKKAGAC